MKKGFTLLEVLVAVAILTSSIVAVFQIFSLGFKNVSKLNAYQDMYLALTNLMEEINTISDFETNKERKGTAGAFLYEWRAEAAGPAKRMTTTGAEYGPTGAEYGPYDIILYRISLKIYNEDKGGSGNGREFSFYKAGWINVQR